jgi:hypothetical protein
VTEEMLAGWLQLATFGYRGAGLMQLTPRWRLSSVVARQVSTSTQDTAHRQASQGRRREDTCWDSVMRLWQLN